MANLYTDDTVRSPISAVPRYPPVDRAKFKLCDDCFIKILYQRVTSPYLADSDYSDYLVDQLQDIGDVCNTSIPDITVRALQIYPAAPPLSSIAFTATSTLAAPASTGCGGQTISASNKRSPQIHERSAEKRDVDPTSTCDSLSNKYGLTTGDLQAISNSTDCTISNTFCFPAPCKLMQVPNGATW